MSWSCSTSSTTSDTTTAHVTYVNDDVTYVYDDVTPDVLELQHLLNDLGHHYHVTELKYSLISLACPLYGPNMSLICPYISATMSPNSSTPSYPLHVPYMGLTCP